MRSTAASQPGTAALRLVEHGAIVRVERGRGLAERFADEDAPASAGASAGERRGSDSRTNRDRRNAAARRADVRIGEIAEERRRRP